MEEHLRQGLPTDDAQAQASNLLLPAYRKKLRHLYLHYLRWYHNLKTDPVHSLKVTKTLRNFSTCCPEEAKTDMSPKYARHNL